MNKEPRFNRALNHRHPFYSTGAVWTIKLEAVASFPHIIGIGLAEDTGLVIKDNFEVIGSGMVIIF